MEGLSAQYNTSYIETIFSHIVGSEKAVAQSDMNTSQEFESLADLIPDVRQPPHLVALYSVTYGVIFLIALVGNLLVIFVVNRTRSMHTLTNFFIVNLAVADMLVAVFCVPITLLYNLFHGWRYGALLCKAAPYLQGVVVCASVNTLAAIAADRYWAICLTLEHKMTWRTGKRVIGVVWALAFLIMLPMLLYHKRKPHTIGDRIIFECVQEWPYENGAVIFLLLIFVVCYVLPLVCILTFYFLIALRVWTRRAPGMLRYNNVIQKSKIQVVKMLSLIVVIFTISWLPLYACFLILYLNPYDSNISESLSNLFIPIAQCLGMSNSAVNPIIYCLLNRTMRSRTNALFHCACLKRRHRNRGGRNMSVDDANAHLQIAMRLNHCTMRAQTYNGRTRVVKCWGQHTINSNVSSSS